MLCTMREAPRSCCIGGRPSAALQVVWRDTLSGKNHSDAGKMARALGQANEGRQSRYCWSLIHRQGRFCKVPRCWRTRILAIGQVLEEHDVVYCEPL